MLPGKYENIIFEAMWKIKKKRGIRWSTDDQIYHKVPFSLHSPGQIG